MRVSFYLPGSCLPSAEKRARWIGQKDVILEESGKPAAAQSWIYRTWMALEQLGCPVDLVHEMPDHGCVVALSGTVSPCFRGGSGLFLAGVVADGLPHPSAQLHVLQNAAHARRLPRSGFMPHWPQPGLLARDSERRTTFERVAFFGTKDNLAGEMMTPAWLDDLKRATGSNFEIRGAARWHDYSDVDAVIAIRDFGGGRQLHKPATKLYNAWLAGVPFIGGTDSAYAAEGEPGVDYLVARTPQEVIDQLQRLKSDPELRAKLVSNGRRKSLSRSAEAIALMWRAFVEEKIPAMVEARRRQSKLWNLCADTAMRGALSLDRIFRS